MTSLLRPLTENTLPQVAKRDAFNDANKKMDEDRKSMLDTISQSQGDLSAYQQDLAKVGAFRGDSCNNDVMFACLGEHPKVRA